MKSLSRRRSLLAVALACTAAFACAGYSAFAAAPATGKIVGKVSDAASSAPLAGATITVGKNVQKATSGSDGTFTLDNVAAGTVQVSCALAGYVTHKQSVVVPAAGSVTVNFALAAAPAAQPEEKKADSSRREAEMSAQAPAGAGAPSPAPSVASGPAPSMSSPPPPSPSRGAPMAGRAASPVASRTLAAPSKSAKPVGAPVAKAKEARANDAAAAVADEAPRDDAASRSNESYEEVKDNPFMLAEKNPFSTFSIDVDTAAYSNTRSFLTANSLPPKDVVRIEELVNYFPYEYKAPSGPDPFSINTEVAACPWNKAHRLALIGLQGRKVDPGQMPPANLVFLIDVSGSMSDQNKLPLLIAAFKLLVNQLRPVDRVALTVYAGAAGLVLPPTSGNEKQKIIAALDNLHAGGSTAGAAGLQLAYQVAKDSFVKGGNNRVIIASDGDFNVGPSSDQELEKMIIERRDQGIFITVLGFGMGNYKDSKMEKLADKGNGNYAYIDNFNEARKVLVNQMSGTLLTIAKDVKIQIEFNAAKVKAYRLIGYENRMLAKEDFADDKKDAGELGAGHTVTAFYELIPAGSDEKVTGVDPQAQKVTDKLLVDANDLMLVKLRYKKPTANDSTLLTQGLPDKDQQVDVTSETYRFASSVAEWGLLLRKSEYKASASYTSLIKRAKAALGKDEFGYRKEFVTLAEKAASLSPAGK